MSAKTFKRCVASLMLAAAAAFCPVRAALGEGGGAPYSLPEESKATVRVHAPASAFDAGSQTISLLVSSPKEAKDAQDEPGPAGGLSLSKGDFVFGAPASGATSQQQDAPFSCNVDGFDHAGVYEYVISQSPSGEQPPWTYSGESYRIRVYIANAEPGSDAQTQAGASTQKPLKCERITAARVDGDSETKVDPTKGITFDNAYSGVSSLRLEKHVEGEYGDKTRKFPFTIELDVPESAGKVDALSCTGDVTATATVSERRHTLSVSLSDGQYVTINDVPVGTAYRVIEEGSGQVHAYTPKARFTYSGPDAATSADNEHLEGIAGDKYEIQVLQADAAALKNSTTVGAGKDNSVIVTNTLETPPSATGIARQVAPYVLLVGLPVVVAAIWLASRRARRDA